jgi:hypothetical protein
MSISCIATVNSQINFLSRIWFSFCYQLVKAFES